MRAYDTVPFRVKLRCRMLQYQGRGIEASVAGRARGARARARVRYSTRVKLRCRMLQYQGRGIEASVGTATGSTGKSRYTGTGSSGSTVSYGTTIYHRYIPVFVWYYGRVPRYCSIGTGTSTGMSVRILPELNTVPYRYGTGTVLVPYGTIVGV